MCELQENITREVILTIDNDAIFYNACKTGSLFSVIQKLQYCFDKLETKPEWFDFQLAYIKPIEKRIIEIQKGE